MNFDDRRSLLLASLIMALAPATALAGPGGGMPLVSFAQRVLDFFSGTRGLVVSGIGLCVAAISPIMGSRDGLQKARDP